MNLWHQGVEHALTFVTLGGPVVAILIALSIVTMTVIFLTMFRFRQWGVGQQQMIADIIMLIDRGADQQAAEKLSATQHYMKPLITNVLKAKQQHAVESWRGRLTGEAEMLLARLQSGFRFLDTVVQLAPLVGLFGTVLGMIVAFQALQSGGSNVDAAELAGGIWVALLTTAMGLAVAMPTSMVLTWFESRVARESQLAMQLIDIGLCSPLETQAHDDKSA
ncbi:MotA/TolQ/ExbB proton channel family protein [Thiomicrospira cyclica]|uniref:MotA/TolQ/ExbB proton channel n=1 Tax=Thiomicrospira cyclica (strain DSM 14477 / JCM 11371 / ALM1) TaxID=717773 RepID=F6DA96_THICA|nr:MotA/TolQ/ExbB proton channel family protein [Thiomicrospira cyclica]AEG31062.1 MotA/TolQ/ExbB proton channel [Thiomicrospira cyclica ALM1]